MSIFELVATLGLDVAGATKIVNAIDCAGTVWGALAILGTVVASCGVGGVVVGSALAMFKRLAAQIGKKAAKRAVVSW